MPYFTTERLVLRVPSEDDAIALAEMDTDPEVMRYIGDGTPGPYDPERARARIDRANRLWERDGYGNLSVIVRETGEYAGWVMLAVPAFLPEVLPAVEIGWRLRREHWGRGYATEAAKPLLDHGLGPVGLKRVVSIRHLGNVQSARVMEKLGLRHEFDTVVPETGIPVAVHATAGNLPVRKTGENGTGPMDLVKVVAGLRDPRAELEDVEAARALGAVKGTLPSTLAAFANAGGGTLIIGLDAQDGFKAAGVTGGKSVRTSIIGLARDKLTPSPEMSVEVVPFEDVSLVVAEVKPLPPDQRPCYVRAKGLYAGAYTRVGGEDQRLTSYEIDRMKENAGQPRWDTEPVPEASAGDLDKDACARLIENAKRRSPRAFAYIGETDALVTLGVLVRREGTLVPTLAGLLSVGRYPQQFFPQLMVTVAVHPQDQRGTGRGASSRFVASATLTGAVPAMVTDTVEMVRRHLKIVGRVTGGGWEDRPEIEPEIIWEALANALMHRDYSPQARGSQVQVDLFPTRLEVSSPGGLFGNVRAENLGASGTSSSRNTRLAALLQETIDPVTGFSVAENRGGGIAMMISRSRQATGVVPLLDSDADRFRVVIPRGSPVTAGFLASLGRRRAVSRLSEPQTTALALAYWGYDVDQSVMCRMGLSASAARVELANLVTLGLLRPARARGDGPYRLNVELKPAAGAIRAKPARPRETPPRETPPQLIEPRRPEPPRPEPRAPEPRVLEPKIPEDQTPEEQIMTALRDLGEASRRELQKATGLSRSQLTDFLQELLDAGLVASTGAALGPNRRYQAVPGKASRTS